MICKLFYKPRKLINQYFLNRYKLFPLRYLATKRRRGLIKDFRHRMEQWETTEILGIVRFGQQQP